MSYKFKIVKTYYYYGYPQAEGHYEITADWLKCKLKHYGNQGYDCPSVSTNRKCNGYFWELDTFMKDFYGKNSKIRAACNKLREGESVNVTLE